MLCLGHCCARSVRRCRTGGIHGPEERGKSSMEGRDENSKTWPILRGVSVVRGQEGIQFIDRRLDVRDLVVHSLRCPFHHALNVGPQRLIGRDPWGERGRVRVAFNPQHRCVLESLPRSDRLGALPTRTGLVGTSRDHQKKRDRRSANPPPAGISPLRHRSSNSRCAWARSLSSVRVAALGRPSASQISDLGHVRSRIVSGVTRPCAIGGISPDAASRTAPPAGALNRCTHPVYAYGALSADGRMMYVPVA
jgi:hypothetical protein